MALPPEMLQTYRDWWQLVQDAATKVAEDGSYAYNSQVLISTANQIARDAGTSLSPAVNRQLTTLFSLARGNQVAATNLTTANPATSITSAMVGEWPTVAEPAVFNAQPMYLAKAQFTYTNMLGEQQAGWISITGITQLPTSTGNLANRLQGAAMSQYSKSAEEGGTPKTDAEMLAEFGEFTEIQLYAI